MNNGGLERVRLARCIVLVSPDSSDALDSYRVLDTIDMAQSSRELHVVCRIGSGNRLTFHLLLLIQALTEERLADTLTLCNARSFNNENVVDRGGLRPFLRVDLDRQCLFVTLTASGMGGRPTLNRVLILTTDTFLRHSVLTLHADFALAIAIYCQGGVVRQDHVVVGRRCHIKLYRCFRVQFLSRLGRLQKLLCLSLGIFFRVNSSKLLTEI